jgi:hypothetical protein
MLTLLEQLLTTLGEPAAPADPRLLALFQEGQDEAFDASYLSDGYLQQELADLIVTTRWAIVRGASRVRLYVE